MSSKDLHISNLKIFILLGQFLFALFAIIYLDYIYLINIRPDQIARQEFVETQCLLMSKKLSTKGKIIRRYRADFLVNYNANDTQYNRWVSGNGLDTTYYLRDDPQAQLLSNYENGSDYTCWYNPKNAENVYLVPRKVWVSLPTILVFLAACVVVILFIRNILILMGVRKEQRKADLATRQDKK